MEKDRLLEIYDLLINFHKKGIDLINYEFLLTSDRPIKTKLIRVRARRRRDTGFAES